MAGSGFIEELADFSGYGLEPIQTQEKHVALMREYQKAAVFPPEFTFDMLHFALAVYADATLVTWFYSEIEHARKLQLINAINHRLGLHRLAVRRPDDVSLPARCNEVNRIRHIRKQQFKLTQHVSDRDLILHIHLEGERSTDLVSNGGQHVTSTDVNTTAAPPPAAQRNMSKVSAALSGIGWLLLLISLLIGDKAQPQKLTFFDRLLDIPRRFEWDMDLARTAMICLLGSLIMAVSGLWFRLSCNTEKRYDRVTVSLLALATSSIIGVIRLGLLM